MKELIINSKQFSIYGFAKESGKRHNSLIQTFNKAVNNLSDNAKSQLNFGYTTDVAKTGKGKEEIINTISMDADTALWFSSKFDDELRLKIVKKVRYLEKENKQLLITQIKQQQELIERQARHNLITYSDGTQSLRKWLKEMELDINERDLWKFLAAKGLVKYIHKQAYIKELQDDNLGEQTQDSIAWNESIIPIIEEYIELSKAVGE